MDGRSTSLLCMAPTELLLATAAVLGALSSATFAFVAWAQRPRYRRGRRVFAANASLSSSALPTHTPSRRDEGSSLPPHSPRTRGGLVDGSVADVEDGAWVRSAGVSFSR